MFYYLLHVFISRNDGYTIYVETPTDFGSTGQINEEELLEWCRENDKFSEDGDENHVDYLESLTKEEYDEYKGLV